MEEQKVSKFIIYRCRCCGELVPLKPGKIEERHCCDLGEKDGIMIYGDLERVGYGESRPNTPKIYRPTFFQRFMNLLTNDSNRI